MLCNIFWSDVRTVQRTRLKTGSPPAGGARGRAGRQTARRRQTQHEHHDGQRTAQGRGGGKGSTLSEGRTPGPSQPVRMAASGRGAPAQRAGAALHQTVARRARPDGPPQQGPAAPERVTSLPSCRGRSAAERKRSRSANRMATREAGGADQGAARSKEGQRKTRTKRARGGGGTPFWGLTA